MPAGCDGDTGIPESLRVLQRLDDQVAVEHHRDGAPQADVLEQGVFSLGEVHVATDAGVQVELLEHDHVHVLALGGKDVFLAHREVPDVLGLELGQAGSVLRNQGAP